MVNYTLTYFPIRGLGEYIRLYLKDNGIPFEDKTISMQEFPKHKNDECFPFKQMPTLTEDGKVIPQTGAILRHLVRLHGLYGSNEDERTFLDVFFDGLRDLRLKYIYMIYINYDKKPEYVKDTLPTELDKLEKLFKTYKNGEGFILGDKMSFVDYVFFEELDIAATTDPTSLDAFPLLKGFRQRFMERPKIKEHLKTRHRLINAVEQV